jgi:hypothetical protein
LESGHIVQVVSLEILKLVLFGEVGDIELRTRLVVSIALDRHRRPLLAWSLQKIRHILLNLLGLIVGRWLEHLLVVLLDGLENVVLRN